MNKLNYKYSFLTPFKLCVIENFPFIEADFDAITNYQLLCKVVEYLNKNIDSQNMVIKNIEALNTWFNNLDVQDEINNKLDSMAESGELQEIITQYLQISGILSFNTYEEMIESDKLINGSVAYTLGFHSINDGGNATYNIRLRNVNDIIDNYSIIALNDELVAELIIQNNSITPEVFGAYGDNINDDTDSIQRAIDFAINKQIDLIFDKNYLVRPKQLEDGSYVCLKVLKDSTDESHVTENNIQFEFKRGKFIRTDYDGTCTIFRVNASNINFTNGYIIGYQRKTIGFEYSKINQLSITESQWSCYNIVRNFKIRLCAYAIKMQGYTFYNLFDMIWINECVNGILLEQTLLERNGIQNDPSVNRNNFTNITYTRIIDGKAIEILYGDTNKFINNNFEGVGFAINIDDPKKHPSDYPIVPQYYTEDNMFINTTFEVVTNYIRNNANGTKIINANCKYEACDFVVRPQHFIGGINDLYSEESILNLYKTLENPTLSDNALKYALLNANPHGMAGFNYCDMLTNYTPLRKKVFKFNTENNVNVWGLKYESVDMVTIKSLGNIILLEGKVGFGVENANNSITLAFPDEIKNNYLTNNQYFEWGVCREMTVPIVVYGAGGFQLTICHITRDSIKVVPPTGGFITSGADNQLFFSIPLFRGSRED